MNHRQYIPFEPDADAFFRALVHAARNRMQLGQSALSLLRLEAGERTELLDLIAEVERGSEGLSGLLGAARSFMSEIDVEPVEVDLVAVLGEVWAAIPAAASTNLEVEPRCLRWPADSALLRSALTEVLSNAVEDSPAVTRVHVRFRESATDEVQIIVADNGTGFSESALAHAMEPFWSTRQGRIGLGLPLANKFMRAHEGSVSIACAAGGGAQVTLSLPR